MHSIIFLAGAQNVTGAYIIIMLVYRRLLTTCLHGKAARKTAKLFVQGYNLEVHVVQASTVHASVPL